MCGRQRLCVDVSDCVWTSDVVCGRQWLCVESVITYTGLISSLQYNMCLSQCFFLFVLFCFVFIFYFNAAYLSSFFVPWVDYSL